MTDIPFNFQKVTTLPDPVQPSRVYIVPNPHDDGRADMYVSDAVGAEALTVSRSNWYATQWIKSPDPATPVANGSVVRLTGILQDTDKRPVSTNNPDFALSIIGGMNGYLQPSYTGSEKLVFRVVLTITGLGGSIRSFRVQLRRQSDDSIVSNLPVTIDPGANPEGSISVSTVSYIFGEADPFIAAGVYVALANNSGTAVSLTSANLLIFREPQ